MAGQLFRAGVGYLLGPNERFQVVPFPFPRLRLAQCKITRICPDLAYSFGGYHSALSMIRIEIIIAPPVALG